MQLIQTVNVASAQANITFSSIPQTYNDLVIVLSSRTDRTVGAWSDFLIKLNTATTNFTNRGLYGTGSNTASWTASMGYLGMTSNANNTASTFGNATIYIPNYRVATAKSISTDSVSESNATAANQEIMATLWNVTDPITEIILYPDAGANWVQYSSASLYGITAGSSGGVTVS